MKTARDGKVRTNWHLVLWPIITLWVISWLYVQMSEFKPAAGIMMPILMAVTAFAVFLLNGIAGSVAQRRMDLQTVHDRDTSCTQCGASGCDLHVVDYQWYLFLITIVFQFGIVGKFCRNCATSNVDKMFRKTLWGSILCPPIILWAWVHRWRILREYG